MTLPRMGSWIQKDTKGIGTLKSSGLFARWDLLVKILLASPGFSFLLLPFTVRYIPILLILDLAGAAGS